MKFVTYIILQLNSYEWYFVYKLISNKSQLYINTIIQALENLPIIGPIVRSIALICSHPYV